MIPDYEVKLLMDPAAVLGADGKLSQACKSAFAIRPGVTKMGVQFVDTDGKEIYSHHWSLRIRKMEGGSHFELTYKKRYPITGGDIDAMVNAATQDGFGGDDSRYEAQVEWGYEKQTLSLSRQKTAPDAGYAGVDLPGVEASRSMLVDNAPAKFDDSLSEGWGTQALATARVFGPVLARRWVGQWNDVPLSVEVWPILNEARTGTKDVVEASFKTDDRKIASKKHDALVEKLESHGWFIAKDSLKTQVIMDRY